MNPTELAAATGDSAWMLVAASLVLLMTPALAFFYSGMTGRAATLNMMMMSFGALGVVAVVYVLWGWSMSYGTRSIACVVADPFECFGLHGTVTDDAGEYLVGANGYANIIDVGFQLTFAVISTAIISGSLAAALFGADAEDEALIEPIDFAGGTVVHISAGTAALVLALVVGKRRGFPGNVSRPSSLPLVMLGAAMLWFGWFGCNGGSAFAADGLAGLAWLNTTVAAAAAMLGWLFCERLRDGRPTSLGAASGVVAGLVAVTPAAGDLVPATAVLLGAIGGVLACLGVGLKYRFGYDDSLDVVGVHLVAGLWGTVGVGFIATDTGLFTGGGVDGLKLLAIQVIIAVVAMLFAGAVTAVIALALAKTVGWRVDAEAEHDGIDLAEHAESARDLGGDRPGTSRGALAAPVESKATVPTVPAVPREVPATGRDERDA